MRSLRRTTVVVHNAREIEVFVGARAEGLRELWVVTVDKGRRRIIHHYLTHDDLEARLAYAKKGDLVWRRARNIEIPRTYAGWGVAMGRTIADGRVVDLDRVPLHLPVPALPVDRRTLAAARSAIVGTWSDGQVVVECAAEGEARVSGHTSPTHPLAASDSRAVLDRWHLGAWQLQLLDRRLGCGVRVAVLRVDRSELHVACREGDTLAHVFGRAAGEEPRSRRTRG